MKRKLLSVITALALCLSLLPGTAWAVDAPAGVTFGSVNLEAGKYVVSEGAVEKTEGEIADGTAYLEYSADTGTLTVHGAFETTATITANSDLTITGDENASLSITGSSAPPIWLKNGSTLTLSGGVDFTGESSGGPPVIHSDFASTFAAASGYSGSIVLNGIGYSPAVSGTALDVESSASITITGMIDQYPGTPGTAVLKSDSDVILTSNTALKIPSLTVEGENVSLTNTNSSDQVYIGDLLTIEATGNVLITNKNGASYAAPPISGGANISTKGNVTISSDITPTIGTGKTLTITGAEHVFITGNSDKYEAFFMSPVTFKDCGEVTVTDAGSDSDRPLLKEGVTVTSNVPVKLEGTKYKDDNAGMVYFKGGIWYDHGEEETISPNPNPNVPPMVWKAGDGWVFWEPPKDGNPAKLTLDNAEYPNKVIQFDIAVSVEVKGRNHIGFIETGSGSMDLNIRDGGTLNAIVSKSVEDEGVVKKSYTVYGKAELDYYYYVGEDEEDENSEFYLTIPQGTELTISSDGLLEIENTEYLDNRGTLVNNGTVALTGTTAQGNIVQTIKSLGLTGTGTVVVGEWDLDNSQMTNVQGTYFNSGVKMLDPAGRDGTLDLSTATPTEEQNAASWENYGYKWEVTKDDPDDPDKITSAKLTLKEGFNAETAALPDAAVEIVSEGECTIGTLQIGNGNGANHTQLTLSGRGPLNIQQHVEICGGTENSLTVARGAQVQVTGGVSVGAAGGVDGQVTVNGTLTARADGDTAVLTGKVSIGSSGKLEVYGDTGVSLGSANDFTDAFLLSPGGRFTGNCETDIIAAQRNNGGELDGSLKAEDAIVIPNGYLPRGLTPVFNGDRTKLSIPGGGSPFNISVDNVPRPSGGGGGVSTYAVTVEKSEHGEVTSNRTNAGSGSTVTLTVTPDTGYVLDVLSVTDSRGNEITLTAQGDGKYTFTMPDRAVTVRAAFACTGGADCPSRAFSDLDTGEWYHEAVDYVLENDLMDGYDNGLFGPNDTLTRAQFVQILFNKEGRPVVNYLLRYDDAAPGAWYTEAVRWAASLGIAGGYGNGMFGPNDDITREQLTVMLWRYAGSPAATEKELHFTDADKASGYALEALRWAAESGVLNDRDGILEPTGQVTRAETAQMLKIFMEGQ